MIETTKIEFEQNLERVNNLINIYNGSPVTENGQPSVATQDILRAAVTFLHATLEDLLRELLRERLPYASDGIWKEQLSDISLPGSNKTNFQLHHLVRYSDNTVKEVLQKAIDFYLDTSNFNNIPNIQRALHQLHLKPDLIGAFGADLGPLMTRRHQIVHQFDSNRTQRGSVKVPIAIDCKTVERWRDSVSGFGLTILNALDQEITNEN